MQWANPFFTHLQKAAKEADAKEKAAKKTPTKSPSKAATPKKKEAPKKEPKIPRDAKGIPVLLSMPPAWIQFINRFNKVYENPELANQPQYETVSVFSKDLSFGAFELNLLGAVDAIPEWMQQNYVLFHVDIPYGLNVDVWDVAWTEKEIAQLWETMLALTKSDFFTVVMWSSLEQQPKVRDTLLKTCQQVYSGTWVKTHSFAHSGSMLHQNEEAYCIGLFNRAPNAAGYSYFNFLPTESRGMGFLYPPVSPHERIVQGDSTKLLNTAQKPVEIMKWLVRHFSRSGDWVCDLCCGSGSFSVASLYEGRNVIALDASAQMVQATSSRVTNLRLKWESFQFLICNPFAHASEAHNHVMWNLLFAQSSIPPHDRAKCVGAVSKETTRALGWTRFDDPKRRFEEERLNSLCLTQMMELLHNSAGEHGTRIVTKKDISTVAIFDLITKEMEDFDSVADRIKLPTHFRET